MSTQQSLFTCFKGKAPDDQVLVIGEDPAQNDWENRVYEFKRHDSSIFTWSKFYDGYFAKGTRFFRSLQPWGDNGDTFTVEHSEKIQKIVPALKSQIQKAIRRCLPQAAVQAAWALLRQDPLELLRRVPVIMVEDKKMHADLPLLVWGMLQLSANPGWLIPLPFALRVLHLVWDLAECKIMPDVERSLTKEVPERVKNAKPTHLPSKDLCLAYSLLIRADYGGTEGDVAMLRRYANWWMYKLLDPIVPSFGKKKIPLPDVTMNAQWIPFTFDFHITGIVPWLLDNIGHARIAQEVDKIAQNVDVLHHSYYVRMAIWYNWSSVRYCAECDKTDSTCPHQIIPPKERNLHDLWLLLQPHVEHYASIWVGKCSMSNGKRKAIALSEKDPQPKFKWALVESTLSDDLE